MRRRSRVLVIAAAASLAAVLSSCSSAGAGGANSLTVADCGDTNVQQLWQQLLIPDFEKANSGVKVKLSFDLHCTNSQQDFAKLAAATQQKKAPGVDLIASFTALASQGNLLAPVGSKVPNMSDISQQIIKAGGEGSIPYRASVVLLAYNPAKVTDPPTSLDGLLAWIKAHPGQFTYNTPASGGSGQAFVVSVLQSHTSAADNEKMTTGYDKSLESSWAPGWTVLKSLDPYVYQKGVYPNGNNQVLQLMSSGQISMAPVWSDQFLSGQDTGTIPKSIKVEQISDPSFTGGAAYMGVAKASTHQALAFKLANFVLQPAEQAKIAQKIAGIPVIPMSKLSSSIKERFAGTTADNLRAGYSSQTNSDINDLWNQKVPSQ